MRKWYEMDECNQRLVIGGQIYLVRNIMGYPFEAKMNEEQQKALMAAVCYAVRESEEELQKKFKFIHLSELKEYEQQALIGKLSMPPQMYEKHHESGLLLSEDESVSVLVNGMEHLCIQVSCPGNHIQEAMALAGRVDDCLNQYLKYAFNKKYGYLTSSPLYMGTGMSASYLLHLPYLEKKSMTHQMEKQIGQYGYSLRPHFDGQTEAPGSIYRIRNRKTLGLSESEIISALEHLAGQLAEQEELLAKQYLNEDRLSQVDPMYRAYGLIKYARKLGYDETMACLSLIHTGDLYHVWPGQTEVSPFATMLNISDAVLSAGADMSISSSERGRVRADYIRKALPVLETSEADTL